MDNKGYQKKYRQTKTAIQEKYKQEINKQRPYKIQGIQKPATKNQEKG